MTTSHTPRQAVMTCTGTSRKLVSGKVTRGGGGGGGGVLRNK